MKSIKDVLVSQRPVLLAPGNYDADAWSDATGLDCSGDKGRTVVSQQKEADINEIVRRFGITGDLPVSERVPLDIDFSGGDLDYRECLHVVQAAKASYESMPVELRNRCGNDPTQLVDFVLNPANRAECERLGLLRQVPATESPAAPIQAPPGAAASPAAPPPDRQAGV